MPPVRDRGANKPRTASTRVAAVAATSRIMKASAHLNKVHEKSDTNCSICFEDLHVKRETKLDCSHQFHRTCLLNWLERKKRPANQVCPNCRSPVNSISIGNKSMKIWAFGKFKQPTLWNLRLFAQTQAKSAVMIKNGKRYRITKEKALEEALDRLKLSNREVMREVILQRRVAKKDGSCKEFLEDIKEEIEKLTKRERILEEMDKLKNSFCLEDFPRPAEQREWNYELEQQAMRDEKYETLSDEASTESDSSRSESWSSESDMWLSDDYEWDEDADPSQPVLLRAMAPGRFSSPSPSSSNSSSSGDENENADDESVQPPPAVLQRRNATVTVATRGRNRGRAATTSTRGRRLASVVADCDDDYNVWDDEERERRIWGDDGFVWGIQHRRGVPGSGVWAQSGRARPTAAAAAIETASRNSQTTSSRGRLSSGAVRRARENRATFVANAANATTNRRRQTTAAAVATSSEDEDEKEAEEDEEENARPRRRSRRH